MASEKILNRKKETVQEITDKIKNSQSEFFSIIKNQQLLIYKA